MTPQDLAQNTQGKMYTFKLIDEVVELLEKGKTKMQDENFLSLIAKREKNLNSIIYELLPKLLR